MKNKKPIVVLAAVALCFGGLGYYLSTDSKVDSFTKAEVITDSKYTALKSLYDLSQEGVPIAMGKLAREYYDGVNIKRNDEKALFWAKRGFEKQDELSTFILARMNYYGEATQADPQKAIQLLELIKDKKLEYKYILAKIYIEEAKKDKNYIGKGVELMMSAADEGFPQAQFEMANTLRFGELNEDVVLDKQSLLRRSAEYLAMAAAQDYKPATRQLGLYFYNGIGVKQDTSKGLELLNDAAIKGDTEAAKILKAKTFDLEVNSNGN
ncbi:tetratricopeptide repeat protein [Comamonas sp.]|uniref:tetratricopeptide repeat protein n=1 Tax=Comamonas sp. TaxID=34028 RepID=UPI0012BEAF38|nr:tetratricopeptide repeat protein [Comamonas sp.]MPS92797.1 sel1 repeat family protein [Comamonas sp.]